MVPQSHNKTQQSTTHRRKRFPYLNEELLNNAIVDDSRVSPGALAEAALGVPDAGHAHAAGEKGSAVREELNLLEVSRVQGVGGIGLLLGEALVQTPLAHDEGVVNREAVDLIDTSGLDRLVVALVARKVGGGASGSEGAWEGKDDDSLAGEEVIGGDILPLERVLRLQSVVADTGLEDDVGDAGSFGSGHDSLGGGGKGAGGDGGKCAA
jgi:hypothetical protein